MTANKLLSPQDYRRRVKGCWLGKAVGGTLGQPYEGFEGPLDLTFYTPVPTQIIPNDDLDLQVLWACVLSKLKEPRVDRNLLAQAWLDHVAFPFGEYGVAIRNLKRGLKPPYTGSVDNWFTAGLGAAIRSELWACLAPGDPERAAAMMVEDACVDHAGDGIDAAIFLASLESEAFVCFDRETLLNHALERIPADGPTARAVQDTRCWWTQTHDWREVRRRILVTHGHEEFTQCPQNIAFTILGWLAGEGDFGRAICIAANCGKDTDCTAASLGAILGLLDPDGIDPKWTKPISEDILISPQITGFSPPKTLDELTDLVLDLRTRIGSRPVGPVEPVPVPTPEVNAIPVRTGFGPLYSVFWEHADILSGPPLPKTMHKDQLPGTFVRYPKENFQDDVLFVEYQIHLQTERQVRLMFNTPQNCRVWVDGRYCFGRESGRMAPSPHYAPINQYADLSLSGGTHSVVAAVAKPTSPTAEWVLAVADARTKLWLNEAIWPQG